MLCSCDKTRPYGEWYNYYDNYSSAVMDLERLSSNFDSSYFLNLEETSFFEGFTFSYYLSGMCDDFHQPRIMFESNCPNLHVLASTIYAKSNVFQIRIVINIKNAIYGHLTLEKFLKQDSEESNKSEIAKREDFDSGDGFVIYDDQRNKIGGITYSDCTPSDAIADCNEIILGKLNNR